MMVNFYPTVKNISIDGEKLFMQFLLAAFSLLFIYIVSRCMKIVEEHHIKTSKKLTKLKSKLDVVLGHNAPVCENVLYRHMVRCRRSLIAGYIKEVMNETQIESQRFSKFFDDLSQNSTNKRMFSSPTATSEEADPASKLNTEFFSEKDNFFGTRVFDKLNIPEESLIIKENIFGQENKTEEGKVKECKFRTINHPLESKIVKTLEGPIRRRSARSNPFEKKRSKSQKWNKTLLDLGHDNLKVYTAQIHTRTPFKIGSYKRTPSQKMYLVDSAHDSGKVKICSQQSNSNTSSNTENLQDLQQNTNLENEFQGKNVENGRVVQELVFNIVEDHPRSDSDCGPETDSEQWPHDPPYNSNNRQKSLLSTIKEESAEEND